MIVSKKVGAYLRRPRVDFSFGAGGTGWSRRVISGSQAADESDEAALSAIRDPLHPLPPPVSQFQSITRTLAFAVDVDQIRARAWRSSGHPSGL